MAKKIMNNQLFARLCMMAGLFSLVLPSKAWAHQSVEFWFTDSFEEGFFHGLNHVVLSKVNLLVPLVIGLICWLSLRATTAHFRRAAHGSVYKDMNAFGLKPFYLLIALLGLIATLAPSTSWAHHVYELRTPIDAISGFFSGLGHFVLGWDHLIFLLAFSLISWHLSSRKIILTCLLVSMMLGVYFAKTLASDQVLYSFLEPAFVSSAVPVVYLGLIGFLGVFLLLQNIRFFTHLNPYVAITYGVVAGFAQGYLMSDGIVEATTVPFIAYIISLGMAHAAWTILCWIVCQLVVGRSLAAPYGHPLARAIYLSTVLGLAFVIVFSV